MPKQGEIQGGATLWARQTIESEIFRNKPDKWFKIWFYLINRVSHKETKKYQRGETFLRYDWLGETTGATPDQIKKCLAWLKGKGMVSTSRSTRGVAVTINNYDRFQTLDNYYCDIKEPDEPPKNLGKSTSRTSVCNSGALKKSENSGEDYKKKEKKKKGEALEKHQKSTREAPRYNKNDKNDKNINISLRAEPADEILTEEQIKAKQLSSDVAKVYDIFYQSINPTINFGNKTGRKACEDLIKKYGIDPVLAAAKFAVANQGKPYCPTITTPYQLKEKMAALVVFKQRENTSTETAKGKEILGL